MPMRSAAGIIAVLVLASACASDTDNSTTDNTTIDSTASDGPAVTSTLEDTMPDEISPDQTAPDEAPTSEPDNSEPSPSLELNPPKTSGPMPPTTAGDPVGGDESLYPGQIDTALAPFVDLAIADLATRLEVATDEVTTISATLVTWSDASMGCPLPGMEYAQVLQDGSLIELGFDATVYRYHSGGDRTPFLCDAPLAAPPVAGGAADL